jgi:hypothetical protein
MKWTVCSCIVGLALLLVPQQGQAMLLPVVTVDSATVHVGDTFSINLNVANAMDLTSWQFDLAYDPTRLRANLVTEEPFLSSFGTTLFTPGVIDNTTGLVSLVANSFVDFTPPPNGSGVLVSFQFTGLSSGLSPLTASNGFLNLSDSGFTVTNGSVGLTPVPLPSTVALMSVGLGILYFFLFFTQRRQTFGQRGH